MAKFEYDYYTGAESEQFRFLRIPMVFFEDPDYGNLGSDEKILYGALHSQVDYSRKNGWVDSEGRTYVMRSIDSIQKLLHNCSPDKARSTLKNLIEFGLIEKKRSGQGKPDLIYVKNFITKKPEIPTSEKSDECGQDFSENEKTNLLNTEKPTSRTLKNQSLEVGNSAPNYIYNNYTKDLDNQSIYLDNLDTKGESASVDKSDGLMDRESQKLREFEAYSGLIKDNIDYDKNMNDLRDDAERKMFDDFYQLILEVVTGNVREYRINGAVFPQEIVKSRFLKLDGDDVMTAMQQISQVTDKIHNVRSYMISTLYNAPVTTRTFISNDVQHGLYGGGWENKAKHEGMYTEKTEDEYDRMWGAVNV